MVRNIGAAGEPPRRTVLYGGLYGLLTLAGRAGLVGLPCTPSNRRAWRRRPACRKPAMVIGPNLVVDCLRRSPEQHDNTVPIVIKRGEILPRVSPGSTGAPGTVITYTVTITGSNTAVLRLTVPPSPTVVVIVGSTLNWDPLSLRFIDADGNVLSPRDGSVALMVVEPPAKLEAYERCRVATSSRARPILFGKRHSYG